MQIKECPVCHGAGKIYDGVKSCFVPCPQCEKERKKAIRKGKTEGGEVLTESLGIKTARNLSGKFVYEAVISYEELQYLDKDSVEKQKAILEKIIKTLHKGEKLNCSYCIGLSMHSNPDFLAYPILFEAYSNHLTVAPFIDCKTLYQMDLKDDPEFSKYLNSDIVVIYIPDYPMYHTIGHAKGVMQVRARLGLPTIFITTFSVGGCSTLLGMNADVESYWHAKGVFVKDTRMKSYTNYEKSLLESMPKETYSLDDSDEGLVDLED